jgi:hypothetical protein
MARRNLIAVVLILCCAMAATPQTAGTQSGTSKLDIAVLDQSHLAVPAARVEIKLQDQVIAALATDETGHAVFPALTPGHYTISASREGFETAIAKDFEWKEGVPGSLEITLKMAAATKQSVEVRDTTSPVEVSSVPSATVGGEAAKELPSRPSTVSDALPLIPGVARQPGGKLQLSGSAEHRSAMIVNSADVTDPATGEFGLTVPIDSVESLNFYQTSYLAENGRFTAGLVSVETKRGGDKWKWELNDPLPEFNIRSWGLRGLRTATPRLNAEGPIIPGKLYFSEGFDYEVRKTPVFTLPFPVNQKKSEGFNSFGQLDWVTSDKNLMTATIHLAPQKLSFVNLDYYNPQPTTPDAGTHNYTGTISDKWTIFGGLWENTISATQFDATVWPKGSLDFVVQPQIDSGNYFAQQNRDAKRYSWSSSFAFVQWKHWGVHSFKAGVYVAESKDDGQMIEHPIDIEDTSGHLLERIAFTGGAPFNNSDTEVAFYGQDHWVLNPHLSIDLGLRTESQEISEALRLAPRAAIAWNPFTGLGTVVRAGAGVFYDRVPLGVYSFDQYPERVVTFYDPNGSVSAGPFTYLNGLGEVISRRSFIFTREVPGNFSPRSTTGSLQIEQPITKRLRLRAGYLQTVSSGLVILDSTVPDPTTNTAVTLLSGNGTARYRQFDATARVRMDDKRELCFSYVRSHATGDLNDFAGYIGSFPNAIIHANQVATLPTDLPNRFLVWGHLQLPHGFGLAPVFEYRSGFPYSEVDVLQHYVGIPYSTRFPNFLSADARVWRDFKVSSKYSVRLSVSSFNLTNHFNPEATHWNAADPAYGLFFGERHRRFTADFDVLF